MLNLGGVTGQYYLQLSLVVADSDGNRTSHPSASIYAPAKYPHDEGRTIAAGASYTFFDDTRSTAADNTTTFTFALSPLDLDPIYRFTWSGGTAPQLRTPRAVDLSGLSVTSTLNANQTLTVAAPAGSFAAAVVGDQVFVPGVATGDAASVFSEDNVGFWVILSKDGTSSSVLLARRSTDSFSGRGETVIPLSAEQFQVFSADGVQPGDYVLIRGGFSAPVLRGYQVREVTATWFEVVASDPLPILESGTAGTPPIFYSAVRSVAWLQVDQETDLEVNGLAAQRVSPVVPASIPGQWLSTGPTWSLRVTNKSAQTLRARLIGAS